MSDPQKIQIVGIGDDGLEGLTEAAQATIRTAEVLIGTARNLAGLPDSPAERLPTTGDLAELVEQLRARSSKRVVMIATGDPMFYGVTRYLCEQMGKDRFEILPHVSTMQLAFARVKESWDEAYLANVETVGLSRVIEKSRSAEKVGLFTSEVETPGVIASQLLLQGIDYFTVYVCENLGSRDERVTHGDLSAIAEQSFAPLNVMILIRKPNVPDRPSAMAGQRLFGNDDETFAQSQPKRGLLTPLEIRSIALALLDLGPRSVVWDVGAGSGSVSIEASRLAPDGTVYAIEMDPQDHGLILENAKRFGASNVVPVLGQAPDAWAELPDPDAVFIGGTGRAVQRIVELAGARLRPAGRLVVHVGSLENVPAVHATLRRLVGEPQVRMVQVSDGIEQFESLRLDSRNPTFLVSSLKAPSSATLSTQ